MSSFTKLEILIHFKFYQSNQIHGYTKKSKLIFPIFCLLQRQGEINCTDNSFLITNLQKKRAFSQSSRADNVTGMLLTFLLTKKYDYLVWRWPDAFAKDHLSQIL